MNRTEKLELGKKIAADWNKMWRDTCKVDFDEYIADKYNLKIVDYWDIRQGVENAFKESIEPSMYDSVVKKIELLNNAIDEIDGSTTAVELVGRYAKELEELEYIKNKLESEYIFAAGHYRMYGCALNIKECPLSRWFVVGGLKKDVIESPSYDNFYFSDLKEKIEHIYNSEFTKVFSSYEELAEEVIEYISGDNPEIEDITVKPNVILVKAKNKGAVIGRGGSRIKTMQEILKRRIKVI